MKTFIMAPVAAMVMLGLSGTALASSQNQGADHSGVDIAKSVKITNKIDYSGEAMIGGRIGVSQLGMAVIKNQQGSKNNNVINNRNANNASISDNSANGLTGNSGVNVAAGDNNIQSNNTALTVLGKSEVDLSPAPGQGGGEGGETARGYYPTPVVFAKGASVDAEIGSVQFATENYVENKGNHNNASISADSLNNSAGNLGANVASGNGNVQANNFAVSYGKDANLAVSTVNNHQFSSSNDTVNKSLKEKSTTEKVQVSLSGNINDGKYQGNSEQTNNVYPEIWQGGAEGSNHGDGKTYWGHADFDDQAKSGQDGKFKFAESGTIDLGKVTLKGNLAVINHTTGRVNVNNASISSGSLNNASGNVGVNVAAGTNNMQSNSLALSVGNM